MTNKKVTRRALLMSVTSLLICISMLLGTTFAWFTDEVTSGVNKIVAGNLDVELQHSADGTSFTNVTTETTNLFQTAASGTLWEPGAMAMETFKVTNVGNLALKYQFNINQLTDAYYSKVTWDNGTNYYDLTDVIKMVITDTRPATREAAVALFTPTASKSISKSESVTLQTSSLEPSASKEFTVVLYWAPDSDNNVTDNLHNLKNTGWSLLSPANATTAITAHDTVDTTKDYLYIEPSITLLATQLQYESDSFGNDYDGSADGTSAWAGVAIGSTSAEYDENTGITLTIDNLASVKVPASVTYKDENDNPYDGKVTEKLIVEPGTDGNVTVETGNSATTYEVTLEATDNNGNKVTPVGTNNYQVELNIGVVDLQKFYHKGNELTKAGDNDTLEPDSNFRYNQTTGVVTFITTGFSPFTAEYKFAGGVGTEQYPYLIATADHFSGINNVTEHEKTYYKLKNDLSLDANHYALDYNMDFNLDGNKLTKTAGNALFWAGQYLNVHNGKVELTGNNSSVFGDDTQECEIHVKDLILLGDVSVSAYHYGPFIKYLGNTANNFNKVSKMYIENVTSYVNIKSNSATVGGLIGYCLNSSLSLKDVAVYGNIETGNTAGGIVIGDTQVCGYGNHDLNKYITVSNVKFYGSILVPSNKNAYYYGNTVPAGTTQDDYMGEGATIVKGINIDNKLSVDENNQFIVNADNANYDKYIVKYQFSVDYVDNRAGGYPRYISKEYTAEDIVDNVIGTGIYKNSLVERTMAEGDTLVSDEFSHIFTTTDLNNTYCFDGENTFKLSSGRVTVYLYAYTNETLKAVGTYTYDAIS